MTPAAVTEIPNWYERKFDFTFPVGLYPMICVRLRGTAARLEEIMRSVPGESLLRKPGPAKWSAQEHAGHLLDLEPLWLARLGDFLEKKETLTVTDLSNRKTHEAGYNNQPLTGILAAFREARANLLARLETRQSSVPLDRSLLHPRLQQPMRLVDHLYFVAEHDDHHLAKIWELTR